MTLLTNKRAHLHCTWLTIWAGVLSYLTLAQHVTLAQLNWCTACNEQYEAQASYTE